MNDTNGYPLTMRLPDDTAWELEEEERPGSGSPPGRQQSFRIPDWRQSVRSGPAARGGRAGSSSGAFREPTFEEIMDGNFNENASTEPDFDVGGSFEPQDEREAFEMFMNQGGFDIDENGELVQLQEVSEALEELEEAEAAVGGGSDDPFAVNSPRPGAGPSGGFDDDFVPGGSKSPGEFMARGNFFLGRGVGH